MKLKGLSDKALRRIEAQFMGNHIVPPGTDIVDILKEFSEDYKTPALENLYTLLSMGGVPEQEDISDALTEIGMIRDSLEQLPEEQRGINEAVDLIYCDWLRREIKYL